VRSGDLPRPLGPLKLQVDEQESDALQNWLGSRASVAKVSSELASAITLGTDLTAYFAYDHRLSAAASDLGLVVVQPGA
jgi:hypothetical protein